MTMAPVIIRNMVQVAVQTWVAATLPALRALTRPVWRALTRRAAGLLDKAEIHQKGGGEISDIGDLDPTQFAVAPRGKGRTSLAATLFGGSDTDDSSTQPAVKRVG